MGRLIRVFGPPWRTVEDPTIDVVDDKVVHAAPVVVGGGPPFVFVQTLPASVWTIQHGLGRVPQVTVVRDDGERILLYRCSVPDEDTVVLRFNPAMAGQAVLA